MKKTLPQRVNAQRSNNGERLSQNGTSKNNTLLDSSGTIVETRVVSTRQGCGQIDRKKGNI